VVRIGAQDRFFCRCGTYEFGYNRVMQTKCSVLLVDDHPVARVGLRFLLEDHEAFCVCGEAGDVNSARQLVEKLLPDFIVLDLRLGGRDGVELVEDLIAIHPAVRILIFSSLDEMAFARRTLRAGARGYVTKARGVEEVGAGLERMARGDYAFSEAVQRALFADASSGGPGDSLAGLSDRELQVFRLLGEGRGTADIAEELHLSMKTIGTYRERLKDKLNLESARNLEQRARAFVREGGDAFD
jgi:DNA-binding NarL/FixJ family response regulator